VIHEYDKSIEAHHRLSQANNTFKRLVGSGVIVLAAGGCAPDATLPPVRPSFAPHACPPSLAAEHVRCGSVSVSEDASARSIRTIALNVVVFDALDPSTSNAAQFDLEGGPGFAVTDSAAFYSSDGKAYRQHRAVVLADMRGTGGSGALRCKGIEAREQTRPGAAMYPRDLVAECRDALDAVADVRQYTTAAASRDIDAVRRALGYETIDLNALSYGTTLALRYIADYPEHVRSAVLMGSVPASATPPAHHATAATDSLKQLIGACDRDEACAARYPDLAGDVDRAAERLGPEQGPLFFERIRTRLYLPATSREVPALLHAAAVGRETPDAKPPRRAFADGLYLSITCSESIANMDVDAAIARSDPTPFGSYRLQRQRDACMEWPIAAKDPDLFRRPPSAVPVLLISGAFDPVAPTAWSVELATSLPNSRLVVIPEGAHVMDGLDGLDTCLDAMILRFVETRSVSAIDETCVRNMRAGPFVPL
jgi:pimeloyl-ACP methyl ester carboxylesterase